VIFSKYLEEIILFFIYALLGFISFAFNDGFVHLSHDTVFVFYTVFIVFTFDNMREFVLIRIISTISKIRKILLYIDRSLNDVDNYYDVTKIIFKSFDRLFVERPYALYILDGEMLYLTHYHNIKDLKHLPNSIDKDMLNNISVQTLKYKSDELDLPEKIENQLHESKLNTVFIFPGFGDMFAVLFVHGTRCALVKNRDHLRYFERIQKKIGRILENTALHIDLEEKNFEIEKIFEVSRGILSSLDTKTILDLILESIKSLINYDAAAIFLLDHNSKKLLSMSSFGYSSNNNKNLYLKIGQGSCGWVAESKKIDVINDVNKAEHYYGLRNETKSQISLPLIYNNEVTGVLCLESNRLRNFNQKSINILKNFSQLAAIAIHNARQVEIIRAKQAFESELISAGAVQRGLLRKVFPKVQHLKYTAVNIPSKIVSGDLYDIIYFNEQTLGIAIGDVSGKGAPAALMMTLILAGLRSQKQTFLTVCDMVYRLNNLLYESTIEGMYATFFYGVISVEKNKLYYTNAGHNAPFLIKSNGDVIKLDKGGIVLGYIPEFNYIQAEVTFEKGDLFVAYTDGITETMDKKQEEFGEERLLSIIKKSSATSVYEIKEKIILAVKDFSKSEFFDDDLTLLICKYE
jgi:sigma-B regulation protein RsbU (phosphoserine phosphatase)